MAPIANALLLISAVQSQVQSSLQCPLSGILQFPLAQSNILIGEECQYLSVPEQAVEMAYVSTKPTETTGQRKEGCREI